MSKIPIDNVLYVNRTFRVWERAIDAEIDANERPEMGVYGFMLLGVDEPVYWGVGRWNDRIALDATVAKWAAKDRDFLSHTAEMEQQYYEHLMGKPPECVTRDMALDAGMPGIEGTVV
jgi:hypothetical protein